MPRLGLLLVALLGVLALAPAAGAASRNEILRDCEDDSRLSKNYSARELRDARNNINSGLDAYSDCRDVLSAAIAAAARRKLQGGGGGDGGGGGGATGGGGQAGGAPAGGGSRLEAAPGAASPEISPQERRELRTARENLPEVDVRGQRVVPGIDGVAGRAAGTGLPASLLIPLALLLLLAVAAAVPFARRRVVGRRPA